MHYSVRASARVLPLSTSPICGREQQHFRSTGVRRWNRERLLSPCLNVEIRVPPRNDVESYLNRARRRHGLRRIQPMSLVKWAEDLDNIRKMGLYRRRRALLFLVLSLAFSSATLISQTTQASRPQPSGPQSDLARQNMAHVAASVGQLVAVLHRDPGSNGRDQALDREGRY